MDGLSLQIINRNCEFLPAYMDEITFDAVQDLLKVYNSLTGPVQKVVTHYGMLGGTPCYTGYSDCFNLDNVMKKLSGMTYNFGLKKTLHAGGKGVSLSDMFLGSLGEAVERAIGGFAFFNKKDEIVYGSYKDLVNGGTHCIHPDELLLFANEQFKNGMPYSRFTENSYLGWVKGKRLISGEEIYVPAQMVMMVYLRKPNEQSIGYATSGGMACHVDWETTIYQCICELIERDAINLRWVCGIPPERIVFDEGHIKSPRLKDLISSFEKSPLNLRFYYNSMDIKEVSVIAVVAIQSWFEKYAFLAGGGGDVDIERAIEKAIAEFVQSERNLNVALLCPDRSHGRSIDRTFGIDKDAPESKLDVFFKIVIYYGYSKNIKNLEWYLNAKDSILSSKIPSKENRNGKGQYNFIREVAKNHHFDPICFDFTPPYFKQLRLLKVFIPELTHPFIAAYPYLGHRRYLELPKKMGIMEKNLTFKDLVKLPLPYP